MNYLFLLGWSWVCSVPALAEADRDRAMVGGLARPASEAEITVVATGNRRRIDQTGQSISVIGADELASVQGPDLTRSLARLPGVTFSRNGGLGNFTALRVRGAAAEQLLVMVDSVRVAYAATPWCGYAL